MLRMTEEQFDDAVAMLQKNGHPGDDENVRRVCVAAIMVIRQRRGLDPETTWQPTDAEVIEFLSELNDPANLPKRKSLKRIAESLILAAVGAAASDFGKSDRRTLH
jgi:hypothetical protein